MLVWGTLWRLGYTVEAGALGYTVEAGALGYTVEAGALGYTVEYWGTLQKGYSSQGTLIFETFLC